MSFPYTNHQLICKRGMLICILFSNTMRAVNKKRKSKSRLGKIKKGDKNYGNSMRTSPSNFLDVKGTLNLYRFNTLR